MYANRRNFRVFKEIGVEEHENDESGNIAVSCTHNASGHRPNYRNSSVIVHLAMGQILRSTKRMSRHYLKRLIQYGEFQPPRSLIAVANVVPMMVV